LKGDILPAGSTSEPYKDFLAIKELVGLMGKSCGSLSHQDFASKRKSRWPEGERRRRSCVLESD